MFKIRNLRLVAKNENGSLNENKNWICTLKDPYKFMNISNWDFKHKFTLISSRVGTISDVPELKFMKIGFSYTLFLSFINLKLVAENEHDSWMTRGSMHSKITSCTQWNYV